MTTNVCRWVFAATLAASLSVVRAEDVKPPAAGADKATTDKPAMTDKPAASDAGSADTKSTKSTAAAGSTKKGGKDVAVTLLADAVEKLTTEYREATKKGGSGTLRTKSDYFTEIPAELTPEKVLAALAKSYGSDPSMDGYVRWQLLSALPSNLDEKLVSKGVAAYRSAPRPHMRLGASPSERKELDQAIKNDNVDVAAINAKFTEAVDKRAMLNAPIYSFRTELFGKLPATPDTLIAGLGDAMDRLHAADATGGNDQLRTVGQRTMLWAVSAENPRQKAAVADAVERLRKEAGVEYASEVEVTGKQRKWKIETAKPQKAELDNIIDSLKGASFTNDPPAKTGKKK